MRGVIPTFNTQGNEGIQRPYHLVPVEHLVVNPGLSFLIYKVMMMILFKS